MKLVTKGWLIYLNFVIPLLGFFVPKYGPRLIAALIVLPGMLMIFNIVIFFSGIERSIIKCCIFMLSGLLLPIAIGYIVNAMKNKTLFYMDSETVSLTKQLILYYFSIVVVLFAILNVAKTLIHFFKCKL